MAFNAGLNTINTWYRANSASSKLFQYRVQRENSGLSEANPLDRAVAYLKNELHIARFDLLDATHLSVGAPLAGKSRADAA